MQLLLGCDPEVFVRRKGRKSFHSAYGLNEGTKNAPVRVDKGAVQVDGMALEFNIDPASNVDEWYGNIQAVMSQLASSVPTYEIVATPVARFTKAHMAKQPHQATELGCTPDFNAWKNGEENPSPDGGAVLFRTGAGHVHFGWTKDADITDRLHLEACIMLVKALDLTLGPLCALFDTGSERRKLYGAAGAFRPKSYGCEYRVVSNAWLRDEETIKWVYQVCNVVFSGLANEDNRFLCTIWEKELLEALSMPQVDDKTRHIILNRAKVLGIPLLKEMQG